MLNNKEKVRNYYPPLFLFVLVVLLLCSCSNDAEIKDKAGFSVSRIGHGYDGCYFYAENGKVLVCDTATDQTEEFYVDGISECFANGEYLYCVKDNAVIAVKISDKSEKTVFEPEKKIYDIWADENFLFYRQGNAIYLYRKGKEPQLLVEDEELCDYIPYSADYIEYSVRSAEWADYVKENGLEENADFDETSAASYGYYGAVLRREWYGLDVKSGEARLLEKYPHTHFVNYPSDFLGGEGEVFTTAEKYNNSVVSENLTDEELARILHSRIVPVNANNNFTGVYGNGKTDVSSLSEDYIRACAASAFPYSEKELKYIISGYPDFLGMGDGLTENIYIYPEELFENRVRLLFGPGVEIRHGYTVANDLRPLEYSSENKCYYAFSAKDKEGICEYTVLDGYENNGDEFIVYDKYVYYDSANRVLYASSDKTEEIDGKIYADLEKTVEEYGLRYKHTFALGESGNYYWVSSEQVK